MTVISPDDFVRRMLVERIVRAEAERNERELQLGDSICEVHDLKERIKKLEGEIKSLKPPAANPPWMHPDKKAKQAKAD